MKNRILVALDASGPALKAIEGVMPVLGKDVEIVLFHVLPMPPLVGIEADGFLEYHSPDFGISVDQFRAWMDHEKKAMEEVVRKAKDKFVQAGFDPDKITSKIIESKQGVAQDILEELAEGQYHTVIMGRRGLSGVERFLLGSVSNKVIHHAKDCSVWVVD